MRRIDVAQRRARLGVRHRLAVGARADSPVDVAESLVALHGTDPASVYLAIRARADVKPAEIERALYEDRTLVRTLGMRRTVFTMPVDAAGIVHAACTRAIAVRERRNLVQMLDGAGLDDDIAGWLADLEQATLAALAVRGEATAVELAADEPRLGQRVLLAAGKPYEAWQSISTRVLFLLAADGHIMRARPRGSWISSQYRWSPVRVWLPDGIPEWAVEAAQAELARRWLAAFGPGTAADLKWWTGWTMAEVKRAVKQLSTEEVDLDGIPGLVLAGDDAAAPPDAAPPSGVAGTLPAAAGTLPAATATPAAVGTPPVAGTLPAATNMPAAAGGTGGEPWVALLPALDPTPMGWASRDWFLGPHAPALFDRSGNIGPTVWYDGRVVGGWAQRADGGIGYRLLEDIGSEAAAAVDAEAGRLADWVGPVRVTPRFRTPLEKELAGEGVG